MGDEMRYLNTIIVGSGAAGLSAAVQLKRRGVDNILVLTEGLAMGTSINTGSDKQTYYKMALCGSNSDSPVEMARSYLSAGSTHGDLALVEAALSLRAFFNLVELGVDFPRDRWGRFVGYKTDHDPATRATSVGPYTSREMCLALIREMRRMKIPIEEHRFVHKLLTANEDGRKRVCGVLAVDPEGEQHLYAAENIVFAVGGPGGLYQHSVYPAVHSGAVGVALEAGATACNLPESQFGLASVKFRWNVSGTYMQSVPTFISTAFDGCSERREFLAEHYDGADTLCSDIFLKGYQWPFQAARAFSGSSRIDLFVYLETEIRKRRVFLDFRVNPSGYDPAALMPEARAYLNRSGAHQATPLARLRHMNPAAAQLYLEHGIDIENEMLEIAVCAQHNNGGLAADHWWESVDIKHLFPVGEVNGSHGVARPGGSALNAGQVGALRAAEFIAARYSNPTLDQRKVESIGGQALTECREFLARCRNARVSQPELLRELRSRMSRAGAHIRVEGTLSEAVSEARELWHRLDSDGCALKDAAETTRVLSLRQLSLAHLVYLESILYYVRQRVGSRGSALVIEDGSNIGDLKSRHVVPEDVTFRDKILESRYECGRVQQRWVACRELPVGDTWFETVWAEYRSGGIYH